MPWIKNIKIDNGDPAEIWIEEEKEKEEGFENEVMVENPEEYQEEKIEQEHDVENKPQNQHRNPNT